MPLLGQRTKVHQNAIDAARHCGVTHIIYSSLAFARARHSAAAVMQAHLDTEAYLASLAASHPTDFTYTSIREGIYSESFPMYTSFFTPQAPADAVLIPHDGSAPGIAWAKRDELGEATARLIAMFYHHGCARNSAPDRPGSSQEFAYTNQVVLLSGPRAWTLAETIQLLGEVAGKRVEISTVTVADYIRLPHVQRALQSVEEDDAEELCAMWATSYDGIGRGECAILSPALGELLGRQPEDFETTIRGGWSFHHFH